MKARYSLIFCCLLALTGCVSLRLPSTTKQAFTTQSASQRIAQIRRLQNWSIDGAFSILHQGKADLANYTWEQQGANRYRLQVASALNLYSFTIVGDRGNVRLYRSITDIIRANNPEQLLFATTGWTLPVQNLFYWARGIPANGHFSQSQYDRYGHFLRFKQNGWVIDFLSYIHVNQVDLPRLIQLRSDNLQIKIAIKHWNINS